MNTYDETMAGQNNSCAICRCENDSTTPFWEDINATGSSYQLLCESCFTGVGAFQHNPVLLRIAANYIEENNNGRGELK